MNITSWRWMVCGGLAIGVASLALLAHAAEPAGQVRQGGATGAEGANIKFTERRRAEKEGKVESVEKAVEWAGPETALIIVDMWDKHWCAGATQRAGEIAPKVNELAKAVRGKGGLIIHGPSDCMKFYEGTPQRALAKDAPRSSPPVALKGWRYLDLTREGVLPIDDKDGGCDCDPRCAQPKNKIYPWSRENPAIEVLPGDAVSQDGAEVYNLFAQKGIKHAIVCGVHLNMCVLGRTFAIRQLTDWKFDVVLARDLTDTMYNHQCAPFVPHAKGTELVIEHVERYWCGSAVSAELAR